MDTYQSLIHMAQCVCILQWPLRLDTSSVASILMVFGFVVAIRLQSRA